MRYFDKNNNRLIFIKQEATPDFWDEQWNVSDLRKIIVSGKNERFVSRITSKYIPMNSNRRILEGGCGKGNFVFSLQHHGYDAYGVDFAAETVKKINTVAPELNISIADVRELPFEDNFFDGYWSLGVIEHFYEGYEQIAKEMLRVLKPGGFLFLTFPYLSPLRRLKKVLGVYPALPHPEIKSAGFYQFALDHDQVVKYFGQLGFERVWTKPFEGFKGLK